MWWELIKRVIYNSFPISKYLSELMKLKLTMFFHLEFFFVCYLQLCINLLHHCLEFDMMLKRPVGEGSLTTFSFGKSLGKQSLFIAERNLNQCNPYKGQFDNIYQNCKCIQPLTQEFNFRNIFYGFPCIYAQGYRFKSILNNIFA